MKLLTIDYIPGADIEVLGVVKGTVVQSKNIGRDFMAGMKTLVGGEIVGYTEMLIEARQIATKRMVDEAEELGADAVIGLRYGSSQVMDTAAEVLAYGTAVKIIGKKLVKRAVVAPFLHMGVHRGVTRTGIVLGDRKDTRIVQTAHDGTPKACDRLGIGAHVAHGVVRKVNNRAVHGVEAERAQFMPDHTAVGVGKLLAVPCCSERAGSGEFVFVISLLGIADDQDRVIGDLVDLLQNIVSALCTAADPDRAEAMLTDHLQNLFNLVFGKGRLNVGAKHHAELLLKREIFKAEFFFHGEILSVDTGAILV